MKKIIAVLLFVCAPAQAGELFAIVNGKAVHLQEKEGVRYNERNYGGGLQYDFTGGDYVPFVAASEFRDSNDNPSYYAGGGVLRRFRFSSYHADAGVIGFAMWRQEFHEGRPFLAVLPAFSFGGERVSINATYIPAVEPKSVPLLFFQLKIRIGGS